MVRLRRPLATSIYNDVARLKGSSNRSSRCDMECRYSPALSTVLSLCLAGISCAVQAQPAPQATAANTSVNASLGELQSQVQELKQMVLQLQQETSASRAEISKLRQELQAQRSDTYAAADQSAASPGQLEQQVQHLSEDEQLLSEKVDQQYQTKLESASKYR